MPDIKVKYPQASADTLTYTFAAENVASSTNLDAGRAGTAVDNRTAQDLDHIVSGKWTSGGTPTAGRAELWAYVPIKIAAGVPTYPDAITGIDANKTLTSAASKFNQLVFLGSIDVDTTANRTYFFKPASIAQSVGAMPAFYGLFITHNTGAPNATAANFEFTYQRIQAQTV